MVWIIKINFLDTRKKFNNANSSVTHIVIFFCKNWSRSTTESISTTPSKKSRQKFNRTQKLIPRLRSIFFFVLRWEQKKKQKHRLLIYVGTWKIKWIKMIIKINYKYTFHLLLYRANHTHTHTYTRGYICERIKKKKKIYL